jgi:hypothetical protein
MAQALEPPFGTGFAPTALALMGAPIRELCPGRRRGHTFRRTFVAAATDTGSPAARAVRLLPSGSGELSRLEQVATRNQPFMDIRSLDVIRELTWLMSSRLRRSNGLKFFRSCLRVRVVLAEYTSTGVKDALEFPARFG